MITRMIWMIRLTVRKLPWSRARSARDHERASRGVFFHARARSWSRALRARDQGSSRTVNRIIQIIQIILVIILLAFQAYSSRLTKISYPAQPA